MPVLAGGVTCFAAEGPGEIVWVAEARKLGDFGQGQGGADEEGFGLVEPDADQFLMRRAAEVTAEAQFERPTRGMTPVFKTAFSCRLHAACSSGTPCQNHHQTREKQPTPGVMNHGATSPVSRASDAMKF